MSENRQKYFEIDAAKVWRHSQGTTANREDKTMTVVSEKPINLTQ